MCSKTCENFQKFEKMVTDLIGYFNPQLSIIFKIIGEYRVKLMLDNYELIKADKLKKLNEVSKNTIDYYIILNRKSDFEDTFKSLLESLCHIYDTPHSIDGVNCYKYNINSFLIMCLIEFSKITEKEINDPYKFYINAKINIINQINQVKQLKDIRKINKDYEKLCDFMNINKNKLNTFNLIIMRNYYINILNDLIANKIHRKNNFDTLDFLKYGVNNHFIELDKAKNLFRIMNYIENNRNNYNNNRFKLIQLLLNETNFTFTFSDFKSFYYIHN